MSGQLTKRRKLEKFEIFLYLATMNELSLKWKEWIG